MAGAVLATAFAQAGLQAGGQAYRSAESHCEDEVSGEHVKPGWICERVLSDGDLRSP